MKKKKNIFADLMKYPSALAGLIIVGAIFIFSIYTMIKIPYREAIVLWRGGEEVVYKNPRNAVPTWYNWFLKDDLPVSFVENSIDEETPILRTETERENGKMINYEYSFDFDYNTLPQELFIYSTATFKEKNPFLSVSMVTPSGEEIKISDFRVGTKNTYRFNQDEKLITRLNRLQGRVVTSAMDGIFNQMKSDPIVTNKGTYTLKITVTTFEADSDVNVELVMHGQAFGWFGTDHLRRDLKVAIMWGAPIALAFGLTAAVATSVLSMVIAAIGSWFGGWLDETIQRITEINALIPFTNVLIMVGTFYSRSIWVILMVTIALSIFSLAIKTERAIFLQVKESTYIEAAKAYGAGDWRIIFKYMVPRIIPTLIPSLVSSVPSYVFLEASLSVLGVGDSAVPTWGKVINDAYANGALYQGMYYWILEPAALLMITGLGFALLGFALDRIFNPRLREI